MELQVERRDGGEVPVLAVHGELDLEGAPGLRLATGRSVMKRVRDPPVALGAGE